MVWPVVAVAAASALAQYYQSEKARGAEQARLNRLEADFKRLVPPNLDLSIMDPPHLIQDKIPEPTYDMTDLKPEMFKVIGNYSPELVPQILEQKPELIKETGGMKEGREAQLGALRKLKEIGAQDSDPFLRQQLADAQRQAQAGAQSRQQSVLQDMQRRGGLNSGLGLMAQLQGGADNANRAAILGQQAAAEAYRNRLEALRGSAQLGGQIRDQDTELEGRNVGIINAFNERTSRSAQQQAAQRAQMLNEAQRFNLQNQQDIANQNIGMGNQYAIMNRDRKERIGEKVYDRASAERDKKNADIWKIAQWKDQQRNNANQGELAKAGYGQANFQQYANLSNMQGQNSLQGAADRNQALQGLTNAAIGGYTASNAQDREDKRLETLGKYYNAQG